MLKKQDSLTINILGEKSCKTFRPRTEHSSNRYLTLGKTKNSNNSLTMLYESNIHLKQEINKLQKELSEIKKELIKKDLELKEKDKIIKYFLENFNSDPEKKELFDKADMPVLITLLREKYTELEKKYKSKCDDNKILKANINLTKLNEFIIENDTLKKEMSKINLLYKSSIEENKNVNKELNDFKKKFLEQHTIIINLQQQCESLNDKIDKLKNEKDNLEKDYENNINKQKALEQSNSKLKKESLRLLIQKKRKENFQNKDFNYEKKIEELMKSEKKLKADYCKLRDENRALKRQYMSPQKEKEKNKNTYVQQSRFKSISHIEIEGESKTNDKIELYKSLIKENKIKNALYERYFKENNVKPEDIIKKDFNGIINSENNVFVFNRNSRNDKDDIPFSELLKNYLISSTRRTYTMNGRKEIKLKLKLKNLDAMQNNSRTIEINNNINNENVKEEEDKK